MSREPRREELTICTAIAPDAGLTVRPRPATHYQPQHHDRLTVRSFGTR